MNEYFDPQPSAAEITAWLFPNGEPHKVPGWPRPNSVRVDSRFRLKYTQPIDGWTASRYIFRYLRDNPPAGGGGAPQIVRWGRFDMELFTITRLRAVMPLDIGAMSLVIEFTPGDVLSLQPGPGIEVFGVAFIPTVGASEMFYEWGFDGPRPWRFNVNFVDYPYNEFDENHLAAWPWFINQLTIWGVTDCYTFPRIP